MKRLTAAFLLLLAFDASAQRVGDPRLHVLDNGLRVITAEDHSVPVISAVWTAHVGDSAEPLDFAGNSHFLEHLLLFRGTEKYPKNEIGEWAASRGGYFNGYTWYDYTAFVLMTSSADLDAVLDRHEQMMFYGAFSGQDFETEKKAVFEELRSGQDTPYGYLWRAGSYHMYPQETFYSRSTIGTIETVQAATVERVREYYRDYYVPSNMTLAVAGDFDTDDVLRRIEERFGKYPPGNVPNAKYDPLSMKPGVTIVTEERDLGKAYFLMAVEGPTSTSPEFFPYLLLSAHLSLGKTSELFDTLVTERELLDDVDMAAWPRRYPKGWQGMSGETEPGEVEDAVLGMWEVFETVKRDGVADDALELAKKRLLKQHWQALDDIGTVAEELAIADANGDYRLFAEFEERLAAVSAADVQAVARKYLTPDHFFLMGVFPPGEIPAGFEANVRRRAAELGRGQAAVTRIALDSGVTLLYEPKPGATMESYAVAVRAGTRHGESAGLAEAVATMMVRETANYPKRELQALLDRNGLALDVTVEDDAAIITIEAPAGNAATAMNVLSEIVTNPAFSDREWANVRAELMADREGALDQPRFVATELLTSNIYAGTPYGRSVSDELDALPALTSGDLRAFWKRYYTRAATAVAYTGPEKAEIVAAGLAPLANLGDRQVVSAAIDPEVPTGRSHVFQAMPGKTQTNLYIAWHAPAIDSDDWLLWQLAERAIGGDLAGRLWKLRQEEGLAYSVWLFGNDNAEQPITSIYMATAGDKREAALAALQREIDRAQAGLSQAELDRVKVSYLASMNRYDRTAARRAERNAGWWVDGFGPDRREQITRVVEAATLAEVNRVLRDVLDPDNYVFVEAGAVGL